MMLLLLAPSSPLPHSIHHLGCHLPEGRDSRTGVLISSPRAGGQQDPAARAQTPGKVTRCPLAGEDVQNSAQGTQMGRDSLRGRCMPAVPGGCSLSLAHSSSPLHQPPIDYLPVPRFRGLCHCHTVTHPAAARHAR